MREIIEQYLLEHKKINVQEAWKKFNCTRLSEYIRQLRERGYIIENVRVYYKDKNGKRKHYDDYTLRGMEKNE